MIRLEVTHGATAGSKHESAGDVVRIGRAADNDLVLPDEVVSGEHLRVVTAGDKVLLRDMRSTNGTTLVRGPVRILLDDTQGREIELQNGDVLELGGGDRIVRLAVGLEVDHEATHVLAMRKIDELGPAESAATRDGGRLRLLYDVQKNVGGAVDLNEVLVAVCDGAFALVPGATHVTVVLREDEEGTPSYVPIVTRVRGQQGPTLQPIPVTRSVFRKVVSERAAVLAADAPREVAQTESLMGAQIRSVLGVPLWRGDEILGVLQMDNRESAGVFTSADLDVCAVLGHHASLAVANARLVQRLKAAEEKLKKENTFLKTREESRRVGKTEQEIIGHSAAMRALFDQLTKVVDTRVTVLIEGETGVGQGAHRRRSALPLPPPHAAVRQPELRRDAREPARVRALRPQEGQLHRRPRGQEGPVRDRRRGHAVPRRGDRDAACPCRASCCACCRRGRSAPSARRRRSASTCASSPRRTATSRRRSRRAASARTSTTA